MRTRLRSWPFIVGAALSACGFVFVYLFFVRTSVGQQIDESAFVGADRPQGELIRFAQDFLGLLPIVAIVAGLVVALPIVFIRRNLAVFLTAAGSAIALNVSVQLLKEVLPRPHFGVDSGLANSLPSGHTAIAGSVFLLIFLVSWPALRPTVAVLGSLFVIVTGAFTLVEQWHRPSDVIAAMFMISFWGCCAGILCSILPLPDSPQRQPALVAPLLWIALGAAGVSLVAFVVTFVSMRSEFQHLLVAYVGGVAAIVSAGLLLAVFASKLYRQLS